MTATPTAAAPGRPRAHTLRNVRWGVPTAAERDRLAATVGALVYALRTHRGWSVRRLAGRSAVAPSTVWRLEHGQLRPRRITLCALAWGINPDNPGPVKTALIEAAGDLLRPDTDGAISRRRSAIDAAIMAGRYAMPARITVPWQALQRADQLDRRAMAALERPGALDDPAALAAASADMAEAGRLRRSVGHTMALHTGRRILTAGFG